MNERLFDIVSSALKELNEEIQYDHFNNIDMDTAVMSGDESLDSLSLVRLIVMIEGGVEQAFGRKVGLAEAVIVAEDEMDRVDTREIVGVHLVLTARPGLNPYTEIGMDGLEE